MSTPPVRYAKSGDLNIAYQVVGDGPLDLLLVPGFVSHLDLLWEQPALRRCYERLASFSRLILFDRRGQGLSDRPGRPHTLEEGADDIRAVLDAAGSERAALFGISEGGPLSILFAASFPERTQALVLFGTYARTTQADDYEIGLPPETVDSFYEVVERDWGGPVVPHVFAPSLADDERFREWWARFLRLGVSPSGAIETLRLAQRIDVRETLSSIVTPTLVVHREGDRLVPLAMGRYLADEIEGARLAVFPGEDHLVFTHEPDAIIDETEEFLTGARHAREIDRMLATVMFTDIVASTERAARLGDRDWRDLVESHDSLVRRQLERFDGRPIKTMGDGFLATFDGPARAIRCASSIAEEVRRLGIEIRAGLHTGECDLMNGGDLGGMAVNIGARVASKAEAGEVLVSGTVKDLVVGSGIEFADRGTHELKGVPGEWRLYAVGAS
jgi:class 3 adenylate cyclase